MQYIKETYDMLSMHKITFATPRIMNSGYRNPQLASCVLNTPDDDTWSLNQTDGNIALYSKFSGVLLMMFLIFAHQAQNSII